MIRLTPSLLWELVFFTLACMIAWLFLVDVLSNRPNDHLRSNHADHTHLTQAQTYVNVKNRFLLRLFLVDVLSNRPNDHLRSNNAHHNHLTQAQTYVNDSYRFQKHGFRPLRYA